MADDGLQWIIMFDMVEVDGYNNAMVVCNGWGWMMVVTMV